LRTPWKKVGLAAVVALAVAGSAGAALAQRHGGGGHGGGDYYDGGYYDAGYYGYGGGYYGGGSGYYGGDCYRRVWIDRWGNRRIRRICY